jgi:hypothetical protein
LSRSHRHVTALSLGAPESWHSHARVSASQELVQSRLASAVDTVALLCAPKAPIRPALSCFLIGATATVGEAQFASHHRPIPVFLTIDETLANAPAVDCGDLSASWQKSRRILANVFRRSVLTLAVYRNEGSRIDFTWVHRVASVPVENSPTSFRELRCNHSRNSCTLG